MKKIFFLRSSSSNGGENSVTRRDKTARSGGYRTATSRNAENKLRNSEHFVPDCGSSRVTETKTVSKSSIFRRSRSLSMSSAVKEKGKLSKEDFLRLGNHQRFPSNLGACDCLDCQLKLGDRGSKPETYNITADKRRPVVLRNHAFSSPSNPTSPRNSCDSTSFSDRVLDLHMDGDHLQQGINFRNHRFFVEESDLFLPSHETSRESSKLEHRHESPRKLAKDVVQRLQRLENIRDLNPRESRLIWPPMTANVCDKHLDDPSGNGYTLKGILDEDSFATSTQSCSNKREYVTILPEDNFNATDLALRRKLDVVKQKAAQLSKQLSQERPFRYHNNNNVSALSEMIRNLIEEERNLVVELSDHLQCRLAERSAAKEAALLFKKQMDSVAVKQERENNEFESRLRRELDRRTDEWESKLREFKSEERWLKDRLKEVADQNTFLEREVLDLCSKEEDYTERISHMEVNLKDLIDKLEETRSENENLQQKLSDVKHKLEISEEVRSSLEKKFQEKETESTELIKAASRLRGTCSEQERTIDGLRQCLNSEIINKQTSDKLQNATHNLLAEQSRLTEVEQVLRRKLETCTAEVQSLRTENIYLLERLKAAGKVSGRSVLKLDQELLSCVQFLEKTGLSILNDSIQTCEDLIKIIRRTESQQGIQYEMKVQGLKHGLEQLTRSLGKASFVLLEKPNTDNRETELSSSESLRWKDTYQVVIEDDLRSELKAENLLTSILKEKMYYKEKEIERFQAELARALGSRDALKSEMQDAFDTVSCLNHKMKNFQLQIIQKDGTINQLQVEVQSQEKELGTTKTTLSKVAQERDMMWEEVKRYSENNMLLNRELSSLKKKIDALEEDALLKDGQISILKDSLSNARSFDVLFGVEQGELFKLQ